MKYLFLVFGLNLWLTINAHSQNFEISLWQQKQENIESLDSIQLKEIGRWITYVAQPTIAVYLPVKANANNKAIVICPGGGYRGLAYDWEGVEFAKWLNTKGIAGIVLKYRLPNIINSPESHKTPLADAERAIKLVRANASQWNINPNQVGIMGFSAGGHLASTLGTHFGENDRQNNEAISDSINQISSRPDFMALIYPVITMDQKATHNGSRKALIGQNPSQSLINQYSNELHINANTPPAFIVHASDDLAVPIENSLLFYQSLIKQGIYTEMHIYPYGGHGFALALSKGHVQTWTARLIEWLNSLNLSHSNK